MFLLGEAAGLCFPAGRERQSRYCRCFKWASGIGPAVPNYWFFELSFPAGVAGGAQFSEFWRSKPGCISSDGIFW